MEKLEPKDVEHGVPLENGDIEVFITKEWGINDIANKINEIIDYLNKKGE